MMDDSHTIIDMNKESEEKTQMDIAKEDKAQDSSDNRNASDDFETKPNPDSFPNYCDKALVKGKVVLVVNKFPNNSKFKRRGAKKDQKKLKHIFIDVLGFEQLNETQDFNLKKLEVKKVLEETSNMDYSDTDLFVFAISTHGNERPRHTQQPEHALMCEDEEYVFTNEIINTISSIHSLAGKPKIFFIQACRIPYDTDPETDPRAYDPGHSIKTVTEHASEEHKDPRVYDQGHDVMVSTDSANEENKDSPELETDGPINDIHTVTNKLDKCSLTDNVHATEEKVEVAYKSETYQTNQSSSHEQADAGHREENEEESQPHPGAQRQNSVQFLNSIRCPKDCLVVYAIQSGKIAWRCQNTGSWLFDALYEVIQNYNQTSHVDIFDVLTKTAFRMAQRKSDTGKETSSGKKAVPVIQHRLTKGLLIPMIQRRE